MIDAVPFFRPAVSETEIEAVADAIRSGWLTTGPNCAKFEEEFTQKLGGCVQSIAVNSATAALHLGLEALGVGPGDEVIVPTLTFTATAEVVRYLGATPVLVDIDPETFCVTVDGVAKAITSKTKVIMPVHFAGRACDLTGLRALADEHGLKILDDAAHALPTEHNGTLIGSSGSGADITAFSFYANKTMTTGEGGMLTTTDPDLAKRVRFMRLHGIDRDVFDRFTDAKASWFYDVIAPGYKYNLTDMAAALGRGQLSRIDEFRDARSRLAKRYNDLLGGLPIKLPPNAASGDRHSWHLYIIRLREDAALDRSELSTELGNAGIGHSVHYRPLHQMTFWSDYAKGKSFPGADDHFARCISLPLFMTMSEAEQDYVVDTMRKLLTP